MSTVRKIAAWVAAAVVVVSHVQGQMRTMDLSLPAYSMHVFEVPAGEPPIFVPQEPLELVLHQYHLADDSYICAFPTGPPGRIVIDAYRNGAPGEMPIFVRLLATVEGDGPEPDPEPNPPPLTGLAKQVYESADAVNRPADARRIGAAYRSVASAIAAGGIRTLTDARAAITTQMQAISPLDRAWKPTGDLLTRALNEFGQTVPEAQRTLQAIADGLEGAGR